MGVSDDATQAGQMEAVGPHSDREVGMKRGGL